MLTETTHKYALRYVLITKGADLLRTVVRIAGIVLIMLILKDMIVPFAGEQSEADINFLLKLVTGLELDQWLAYAVAALSLIWGSFERRMRRDYIKRFSERNRELEKKIDPGRTSSGLTSTGETRPED